MNNHTNQLDDTIDLKEFLLIMWAHKIIVMIITFIVLFYGIFYSVNAPKVFTARAILKLEKNDNNSLGGSSEALFALSGFNAGIGDDLLSSIIERVMGRIFIEEIDKSLDLKSDAFFNSYKANGVEAEWKTFIKNLIGYVSVDINENEVIWNLILGAYRENVSLSISDANSIIIEVTHDTPERSAKIANEIMQYIIDDEKTKSIEEKKFQLDYLSKALAGSLFELEKAQNQLQNFTLNKTSLPEESFAVATVKLESEKLKFEQTTKLYLAVMELAKIYEANNINATSYNKLRLQHPIVDEVIFRRIFGQNEIVTAWSWPDTSSVNNVLETLADRKNRLEAVVSKAQIDAENLANSVEKYGAIVRDVKEAEAVYTVMLEQVKQNSIVSGYNPETSIIYEYAMPPINPSAPNRKLIILISFLIGLFISLGFVFLLSLIRGVYYSNSSLLLVQKVNFNSKTKVFRRLAREKMERINNIAQTNTNLRDLKLEIDKSNKKFILISGLGSKLKANELSCVLGVSMQADGKRVSHINFSNIIKDRDLENKVYDHFKVVDQFKKFEMLAPLRNGHNTNFLTKVGAKDILFDLRDNYDFVILSAENNDALSLARFQDISDTYHVILTRKNRTKKKKLEEICNTLPLGALLHD